MFIYLTNGYVIPLFIIVTIIYYILFKKFIIIFRKIIRRERITQSPVLSFYNETL